MSRTHTYAAELGWEGSTGAGYAVFLRDHDVRLPPAQEVLELSADPGFRGDATRMNPEGLILAAAASCQMLSFLALAALAGVDVIAYTDRASAEMPEDEKPVRIKRIVLRPVITVAGELTPEIEDQVLALARRGHDECYVANTLNATMVLEARVRAGSGSRCSEPTSRLSPRDT